MHVQVLWTLPLCALLLSADAAAQIYLLFAQPHQNMHNDAHLAVCPLVCAWCPRCGRLSCLASSLLYPSSRAASEVLGCKR
jgi:hypothetical protein